MNVEDRLRAALHGTADLVEDRPRPLPAVLRRRGIPRLLPVWAALVVALVMLGPFVLPDGEPDTPIPVSSPSLDIGAAPEFYVAVFSGEAERLGSRFEVRSTATGELLDTNYAGNGEKFVSIASIPDDGQKEASSFYLLTRLGAGLLPGCTKYTIYSIQISAEGRFTQWGTGSISFEALDGTPANLTTTPKGDEIAYSYKSCGRTVVKGNSTHRIGDGANGERLIAHHWAGTTTFVRAEGKVLNLAYSPDGHSLAVFQRHDAEAGEEPRSELLLTRTANPDDATVLLKEDDDSGLVGGDSATLANAMITPDGKHVVAVFIGEYASGTHLSIGEFSLNGELLRTVRPLDPPIDGSADDIGRLKQHPSGSQLLLQAGDMTLFHKGEIKALITSDGEDPADLAW